MQPAILCLLQSSVLTSIFNVPEEALKFELRDVSNFRPRDLISPEYEAVTYKYPLRVK